MEHALEGMVDVGHRRCGHPSRLRQPTYGMAGTKARERCMEHALGGMVNVSRSTCGHDNCSKQAFYSMFGSTKAKMCMHMPRKE